MRTTTCLPLAALLSCTLGCEVPELEASREPAAPARQMAKAEDPEQIGKEDWYLPDGRIDMSGVSDEPPMTTSTPREVTAKDPKKGKLSRRAKSSLGTVVRMIPWAENKTKFDMIKYNLNIYDAAESHFPRSHEEFMEDYLPNYYPAALPLPELEPGDEYIYDPEDHLLKIHRPEG
jgi:hypothetical protein